jgi:metal-responsive CopG/Arc/MetJ family transcriptional regulator
MRTTKVVSITLPPALFAEAQALAKEENRTMSELFREALRRYRSNRAMDEARAHMESVSGLIGVHSEEDVVRAIREFRRENAHVDGKTAQVQTSASIENPRNELWNVGA